MTEKNPEMKMLEKNKPSMGYDPGKSEFPFLEFLGQQKSEEVGENPSFLICVIAGVKVGKRYRRLLFGGIWYYAQNSTAAAAMVEK